MSISHGVGICLYHMV